MNELPDQRMNVYQFPHPLGLTFAPYLHLWYHISYLKTVEEQYDLFCFYRDAFYNEVFFCEHQSIS